MSDNAFVTGRSVAPSAPAANALTAPGPEEPAAMSAAARAQGARRADLLASLATGLQAMDYADRRSVLAHMAPDLAAHGLPPATTIGFDPTDENLAAVVAQARALGTGLRS